MVVPPGVPRIRNGLSFNRTMVGVIELSILFPGAMALASPPTAPYILGTPGFDTEIIHFIIQQKSGTGHHGTASITSIQRGRNGNTISFFVISVKMGGFFTFLNLSGLNFFAIACRIAVEIFHSFHIRMDN